VWQKSAKAGRGAQPKFKCRKKAYSRWRQEKAVCQCAETKESQSSAAVVCLTVSILKGVKGQQEVSMYGSERKEENVMLLSKVPHNDKVYGKMRIINALFALSFLWEDPILSSQVPVPSCSSKWSERSGGYQANKTDVGKYRLGRDSCERGERRWWFHWETTVFLECQCCGRFPFTGR